MTKIGISTLKRVGLHDAYADKVQLSHHSSPWVGVEVTTCATKEKASHDIAGSNKLATAPPLVFGTITIQFPFDVAPRTLRDSLAKELPSVTTYSSIHGYWLVRSTWWFFQFFCVHRRGAAYLATIPLYLPMPSSRGLDRETNCGDGIGDLLHKR